MPSDPLGFDEALSEAFRAMLHTQADPTPPIQEDARRAYDPQSNTNTPDLIHASPEDDPANVRPSQEEEHIKPLEFDAGEEEISEWIQSIMRVTDRASGLSCEGAQNRVPIAVVPEYARDGIRPDPASGGTLYNADEHRQSSLAGMADFVTRSLQLTDQLQVNQAVPPQQPSRPPVSAPSSSTAGPPDVAGQLSSALSAKDNLLAMLSQAFRVDSIARMVNRALEGDVLYLGSTAMHLSLRLQSTPPSSPEYRDMQSSFGLAMLQLYEISPEERYLAGGVGAVSLALSGDTAVMGPTTAVRVRNWAYSRRLLARKEQTVAHLQEAIEVARCTLPVARSCLLTSTDDLHSLSLELAECLLDRYRAEGQIRDLDDALALLPQANSWDMPDAQELCILSELRLERFLRIWDMSDIDKALFYVLNIPDLDEPLVGLVPLSDEPQHPDGVRGLHVAALVYAQRFKVVMDIDDLDRAVTFARKAVEKCREDHPLYVVHLTDLALLLHQRFEADEDAADLDECIERLRVAAHLPVEGTYTHYPAQAALGLALVTRGDHAGDLDETDEGIQQLRLARRGFSGGSHLEAQIERDLSAGLSHRFQQTQDTEDLDDAISYASSAFDRAPKDDQRRDALALELGETLSMHASQHGSESDVRLAIRVLSDVARGTGRPSIRLHAAMEWAKVASARGAEAALEALEVALDILPLVAWAGNRMVVQYKALARLSADVGPWAAACALSCGRVDDAVSYLERGRNILWAQSLQLRLGQGAQNSTSNASSSHSEIGKLSSFLSRSSDGFPEVTPSMRKEAARRNPELASIVDRLREVYEGMHTNLMQHPGHRPGDFDRIDSLKTMMKGTFMDAAMHSAATRRDTLRKTLSELSQEASALDSLGDLRKNASLTALLERGRIVLLNAHSSRCDAIILDRGADGATTFSHVPLLALSVDEIRGWAEAIQLGMFDLHQGAMGVRDFEDIILAPVLRGLWLAVAEPVIKHIDNDGATHGPSRLLRIWWCPTGPLAFLPIHAAGPYDGNAPGLPEMVVSSYVPTLRSLLRAHDTPHTPLSLLAVGQPDTPGQNPLRAVHKELATIERVCARISRAPTTMVGPSATVDAVTATLRRAAHTWLHFSCHAYQDPSNAFTSAFFMHDGPLTLGALMQLDLSRVQFAFLSACLTSAGDERLPDESIHLAAGLQFAGVRSAIATLWTVDDRKAAVVADKVYDYLLREGVDEPDPLEAAEALHHAVAAMKAAGRPMVSWVPFVHTGI